MFASNNLSFESFVFYILRRIKFHHIARLLVIINNSRLLIFCFKLGSYPVILAYAFHGNLKCRHILVINDIVRPVADSHFL
jgi:hypothetical protein